MLLRTSDLVQDQIPSLILPPAPGRILDLYVSNLVAPRILLVSHRIITRHHPEFRTVERIFLRLLRTRHGLLSLPFGILMLNSGLPM